MQFPQSLGRSQLPLFHEALLAAPLLATLPEEAAQPHWEAAPESFSEVSLQGSAGLCLQLLAPLLRELSMNREERWLTLVGAPASLTLAWLRQAGLNRERILLIQPQQGQAPLELVSEVLRLGRSHTVVSWIAALDNAGRRQLARNARLGEAKSLNIQLG